MRREKLEELCEEFGEKLASETKSQQEFIDALNDAIDFFDEQLGVLELSRLGKRR